MNKRPPSTAKKLWIIPAVLVLLLVGGFILAALSPVVGAYGADFMRKIFGNKAVASAETILFTLKDDLRSEEYKLGLSRPASPWEVSQPLLSTPAAGTSTSPQNKQSGTAGQNKPTSSTVWMPGKVDLLGDLPGIGVWVPYIEDDDGSVIAYRTFLQPDPKRPYSITEVVAFDLQKTQLHFVLGYAEPYAPGVKKAGKGIIPKEDLASGRLLAAFNGGFKYEHGKFGAMSEGFESVKPAAGLGTLVIYSNGQIKMGVWGTDFKTEAKMTAFRQNGPLVIENGQINNTIYDPNAWGFTISGGTVTWRSGIALSPDGNTLYYFAGPSLDITTLAHVMSAVHPQTAMQMDINDFWVHFTIFHSENGKLSAEALFPQEMKSQLSRFLHPYQRDFFYITKK